MIARNRIWEELKQAKANIICIQRYVDKRRAYNRYYNGFIALTSAFGALGYTINDKIPFITSLVVGFVSIVKSIMPNFLQAEPELSDLDKLSDFYARYMNQLEKIWYDFDKDIIDEHDAMKLFFVLKDTECDKESLLNKGVWDISDKEQDKINSEASDYIDKVYFKRDE